jgi:iron complex outermembrane receptor protein
MAWSAKNGGGVRNMRPSISWKICAALSAITGSSALLLATGQAKAAAAVSNAAVADTSNNQALEIPEIIVTAQRRSEKIQDVPVTIQAFTAKMINDLGIKSSTDLGQMTPNVDVALPAGAGNQPIITIRGIGLNDFDTNNAGPNGIYVDEVYLSSPASQTFQTFDLQQIEVLKGPQGTLYGRNTSGGAINFIANKPTDQFEADFHTEYSSFDTFNFEGGVGGPIAQNLDGRAAIVVNESRGYQNNELTGNHENGANNYALRLQLLWHPTDDLKVLFNIHGGQVDNRPTEYRHIGTFVPGTEGSANPTVCSVKVAYAGHCVDIFGYGTPSGFYDGAYNRQQHLRVNSLGSNVHVDYISGPITYTSITSFEYNFKIHPEDSDASPNRLLEINYGVNSNTFTQEFRAAASGGALDWVTGVYFLYEDLHQNQPINEFIDFDKFGGFGIPAGPGAGDGIAEQAFDNSQQVTHAYAAFGQGDYAITDKLKLTLGGRFTAEDRSFHYDGSYQTQLGGMNNFGPIIPLADTSEGFHESAFSWRFALDYHFTDTIHAYTSVATGFKSGDFNGSFLSTNPAEIALQLKPVLPEKVTAYEVGIKSSFFDNRLVLNLAAFYNNYQDMQVFVLVPPVAGGTGTPVDVLDNARKAHTEGIDAELVARPISGLTATLNLGLLTTRLDQFVANVDPSQPNYSGNQLPLSPHTSAAALLDYEIPAGQNAVDLQFSATYKSHVFFDVSNDPYTTQGAYWLENVRIAYQIKDDRWEVAGYVRNLSNKNYLVDAFDLTVPFGFIEGVEGTPRTVGVEANFRFGPH